jgi:N-acetylneuraminic acid mutarotase
MSVAINDKLYVFIGSGTAFPYVDSSLGRRLYRYDPSTNTWTQRAASPDYHGEGIAAAIGGKLYLMGGRDESDLSDDYDVPSLVVTVYDPATNRWTTLQGGAKGDNSSAGTAFQSELWDLGGNPYGPDLEITAAVKAYDPVTGTLSTKAPMLTERWGAAAVKVAYRGTARLLVLGGGSNTLWAVRTVERYTP